VISGFRCDVDKICHLLGYYEALGCSSVPTFRENVTVPFSRVKNSKRLRLVRHQAHWVLHDKHWHQWFPEFWCLWHRRYIGFCIASHQIWNNELILLITVGYAPLIFLQLRRTDSNLCRKSFHDLATARHFKIFFCNMLNKNIYKENLKIPAARRRFILCGNISVTARPRSFEETLTVRIFCTLSRKNCIFVRLG
jgi:hypothetical protein